MSEHTIPGGREKGTPVSEASDNTLQYWASKANDGDLRQACSAEIERRQGGGAKAPSSPHNGQPRQQSQGQAITRARPQGISIAGISGSYRDARTVTARLEQASAEANLVAPSPACGTLPEGCSVALSAVLVDVEQETYELDKRSGKRGLSKSALDKIAGAVGVSWDPHQSHRLDDGSDPHYCHYRAVGKVRNFDGTVRVIVGEKEMDLRDGSAQLDALYDRYEAAKRREPQRAKDPSGQIREMRLHILSHAETKARLRAIRSLGVRTSFTGAELAKPFVVAKVQFDGKSEDPELRRMFASKIADSFMNSEAALYGGAPQAPALPAPERGHAPPPVESTAAHNGAIEAHAELVDSGPDYDVPPEALPTDEPPPEWDRGDDPNAY